MKARTIIILLVVVTVLVLIKVFVIGSGETASPGRQGGKDQPANVTVHVMQPSVLDNKISASGTVSANEEVELKPEIAGRILRIYFKEGSKVSKGELLVKINDASLQAQLKKLELQLKLAQETDARQKKLLDAGGISQQEYDVVNSQVNTLKADVDLLKAQVQETEIYSPFNGIIGLKSVSEGGYITPAITIASIQQTDPVKIDFSIPEKYMSMIKQGDSIRFTIEGSAIQFSGNIYAIEPKIDPSTRTIQLRALCSNKEGKIFPGAFAKIELLLKTTDNNLMIPTEALIPELKGYKVFLVKNGVAVSQKVITGIRTDKEVQIINGLQAGDSVITSGMMQLNKPDTKIKVMK